MTILSPIRKAYEEMLIKNKNISPKSIESFTIYEEEQLGLNESQVIFNAKYDSPKNKMTEEKQKIKENFISDEEEKQEKSQ